MSRRLFTLSVILLPILAAVLKFDLVGRITIDTFLHFFLVPQHPNPFSIHPKSGPVTLFPLSWDADENREILERDLKDAVYVITGSSSGIGLATAKRIEQALGPKQKNRLIHAVRNVTKLKGLLHDDEIKELPTIIPLDLSSLKSVHFFATSLLPNVLRSFQVNDSPPLKVVLINNAAQAFVPELLLTEDGYESQFQSNFLGHYLLTRILIQSGLLKRVVHVSSCLHATGVVPGYHIVNESGPGTHFSSLMTYSDTKLMNSLFSNYLSKNNIKSVAVHPGVVPFSGLARHRPNLEFACSLLPKFLNRFYRILYIAPDEAANNLLYATFNVNTDDSNQIEINSYVSDMRRVPQARKALDTKAQKYLYEIAEMYVDKWLDHGANM